MHIPDGFLDTKTALTTGVLSASGLGAALRQASRHLQSRQIPLIGLMAAFIFVAQMINFPVAGGTSGHLVGGALAVVLLGPSAAIIVITCVLIIQALLFADGGLLALGANVLNMAIVTPVIAYIVYSLLRRWLHGQRGLLVSASLAAWVSIVAASIFCAGELTLSGTVTWNLAFPAMAGVHSLIGIGESLITMLVLAAIGKARPELLFGPDNRATNPEGKALIVYSLIVIVGLLILVVPYASKFPDGLNKVAQSLGFNYKVSSQPVISTPLEGYSISGIESPAFASILAGFVGAAIVFGLSFLLARLLVPKQTNDSAKPSELS